MTLAAKPKRTPLALRLLAVLMSAVFVIAACVTVAPTAASAQERTERRTLLQMLFGRQNRSITTFEERPAERRKQNRNKSTKKKTGTAAAIAAVEKLPTAKKVLVVGDFIAAGLGEGLAVGFAASPGIVIQTRTEGSSGIVRDDYYNWQIELPKLITELQPAAIVVALGSNDRQAFRTMLQEEKFGSEPWRTEFSSRVTALTEIGRKSQLPVLWVGMPAFQSSSMTDDMVTLNGIFRTESEKAGGQFVDIWDGFVDETGKFIITGSDINGQQVRLRGSDGINMTKAGKRKMAFYVEKDIIRLLGGDAVVGLTPLLSSVTPGDAATQPAVSTDILETQPISLADPELDGGTALLGASMPKTLTIKTPRDNLVEKGEVAEAPAGRVDDFRLAKPSTVLSNPVIRN
ncbi:SGNH/GDSL hydrolase family protein [Pararhizobium sp.]|uniref:SGNH/GDSL hydrolase family protein n=1 Tax=Pararhizobium sp. TaxID=1977563 RepID=UPI002717FAE3|nr:DUF459 domain-containing protein [Pararhizobium sp.]MDO9417300.1 DUF459 domain-containing protein [Pararhizobium sp.]